MKYQHEAAREIPVVQNSDVVVCGGGPAGVAAALAAARQGARTQLLEVQGCLGGVWTAGLLSWIIDAGNKAGIMREITDELDRRGALAPRNSDYAYDPEAMKLLLEEMCAEAGVVVQLHTRVVQLHTRVVAAARDENNRLAVAITESKSGRQAWAALLFVDTTGDGDLAAQAGCGFDLGRPESGETQPMTLLALLAGIHASHVEEFIGGGVGEPKKRLLAEMRRAGVEPSYGAPTLFRIRDDLFALSANHQYGVSALDAADLTRATLRARAEIHGQVRALRGLGAPWNELHIVSTGAQIGIREARRIHGHYCVSEADVLSGARHPDAVCRVTFGVDVHSTNAKQGHSYGAENKQRALPYDIPLRALIAADVDGLLLAGRCISGDFIAHSSYRVTGNSVALGAAAGVVAALAAQRKCLPQDVPWPAIESALRVC